MPAVGNRGSELDRPLEGAEVIPERVRSARGPEAHGRRDPREQVIGCDQHAVVEQRQLAVGVARRRDELPAVEPSPSSTSSGSVTVLMNGRYSSPWPISSSVTAAGTPCRWNQSTSTSDQPVPLPDDRRLRGVDAALDHAARR